MTEETILSDHLREALIGEYGDDDPRWTWLRPAAEALDRYANDDEDPHAMWEGARVLREMADAIQAALSGERYPTTELDLTPDQHRTRLRAVAWQWRRLNEAETVAIVAAFHAGVRPTDMVIDVERSREYLRRVAREHGIEPRRRRTPRAVEAS